MSERLLRLTYKRHKNLIKYHRACLKNWAVIARKSLNLPCNDRSSSFFEKSKDKYRMFYIRSLLYALSKALNYCSMSAIFQFLYLWSNTMYYASIKMILTYSQDLQRHQACDLILLPRQHRNLSFSITKFWKLLHIYMLFEGGRSVSRKTFWVFWLRSEAISFDV